MHASFNYVLALCFLMATVEFVVCSLILSTIAEVIELRKRLFVTRFYRRRSRGRSK